MLQASQPVILYAEDEDETREVTTYLLELSKYSVVTAPNGLTALEKARTCVYDLVLTDGHMPCMNGPELVQELRQLSEYKTVPIIVLSGSPRKEFDINSPIGEDAWLMKGVSCGVLLETIAQLLAQKRKG